MKEPGPVTVSIARRVRSGKEAQYEEWVSRVIATGSTFTGHAGVDVLKPSPGTGGEYILLTRFDCYENQRIWELSDERAEFLAELDQITEGDTKITRASGIEAWFLLPEVPKQAVPNKHKMTVIITVSIFLLVLLVNAVLGYWLEQLPYVFKVAAVATIQVCLLSYVILPRATVFFKPWLYPTKK